MIVDWPPTNSWTSRRGRLDPEAAQARVLGGVPKRSKKEASKLAAASVSTPFSTPVVQKDHVEVIDITEGVVTVAKDPSPQKKRKEPPSASTVAGEKPASAGPPTKRVQTGTDLTCGSDLAGSLDIPDDRLSDVSMHGDMDALCKFFVDPPSAAAVLTERQSGKQPEKAIEKAGDRNVTVDSSAQKIPPTEPVAEGVKIYKRLAKWTQLAGSHIMEQERAMAQTGPLIAKLKLDLSAAKGEAGKAKRDLHAAEKRVGEAEKLLLAERAKVENVDAATAKMMEERDRYKGAYDAVVAKRDEWKDLFQNQAEALRDTQAILAQKEKDIEMLQDDLLPKMCVQFRDQAEKATREAIRKLIPDGFFPWDKFDQLLDEMAIFGRLAA
ncbi:uncharacterized protein LOC141621182 [Silene latifolia]|uniref:uncharacterized protein LOC141621182 n=1 Tax=Silene latifolia TaxID=37657 RepID=UPI003D78789E